jgi:hypothetical protein
MLLKGTQGTTTMAGPLPATVKARLTPSELRALLTGGLAVKTRKR